MKVLVVGGNRFVGVEIVWQLLYAGHHVTVLALDSPPQELRPHVRWLRADRNDEAALAAIFACEVYDFVVDNIAYEPAHVRRLAKALDGRVGRYLLTSTTDCYPRIHPRTWTEDQVEIRDFALDGLDETARYMYGKRSCEAALAATGLAWTVVRPVVVTGVRDNRNGAPAGRGTHWFEESARSHFWPARVRDGGPILLCREDECIWQSIWVPDLARAIAGLLADERAVGQAYNVSGDEIWTNERLVRALAEAAGVAPEIVHVPASVIEKAGLDYAPVYGTGASWSLGSNAKLKATGWQPTPAEQWLPLLLEAQGDAAMRTWYHTRMQEIALVRHVQRRQAQRPRLPAAPAAVHSAAAGVAPTPQLSGRLQTAASAAWRERVLAQSGTVVPRADFYKDFAGCAVSSVGVGTWMGDLSAAMDRQYEETLIHAACRGINVFDTAINYRHMRAERCVGRAVRRLAELGIPREALFVSTKGGYITHDCEDGRSSDDYVRQEYLEPGLIDADEMARRRCIAPEFIARQLDRSLANLGLETVDVYFLHNPEDDLPALGAEAFYRRLTDTFAVLEAAVAAGKIGCYGLATWEGLRVAPDDPRHLSLAKAVAAATEAAARQGHARHHLRVLQLPFNVRDHQPLTLPTQQIGKRRLSAFAAAAKLDLYCLTSASVLQGAGVPDALATALQEAAPGCTLHTAALQAARSTGGVGSALAGMRRITSVEEAIAVAALAPLASSRISELVGS